MCANIFLIIKSFKTRFPEKLLSNSSMFILYFSAKYTKTQA